MAGVSLGNCGYNAGDSAWPGILLGSFAVNVGTGFETGSLVDLWRSTALPLRVPLRRIRPATPQVALDRAARVANLRGAYVAEAGALRGARVAFVDDVATTGATLAAAIGALRAAGARSVRSYVVALDA